MGAHAGGLWDFQRVSKSGPIERGLARPSFVVLGNYKGYNQLGTV